MKTNKAEHSFAALLNRHLQITPIKIISFLPSKGGCGNSCMALNYAYTLAKQNKKVLLLDANLSMPSLDVMMGQGVSLNLQDVLEGRCDLDDVVHRLEDNIGLIAGSTDQHFWSNLSINTYREIFVQATSFQSQWDYLIIDCANGLADERLVYPFASDESILVMNNEPASFSKAYSIIKAFSKRKLVDRFCILSNMVFNQRDGFNTFQKLDRLVANQLNIQLSDLGSVPFSWEVRDAVRNQRAFVEQYPDSSAAISLKKMSSKIEDLMLDKLMD